MHDHGRDHSFAQRRRRNRELKKMQVIYSNHSVVEITPYQFRIDGAIDLYPTGKKWHNLQTGERGIYGDPAKICEEQIKKEPQ